MPELTVEGLRGAVLDEMTSGMRWTDCCAMVDALIAAAKREGHRAAIAECKAKMEGLVSESGKRDDYGLNYNDTIAALDEVQP